jgi:uncharacterized membrane protein YqjE
MPSNVAWFERLMIGSILIGLVGVFLVWQRQGTVELTEIAIAGALIVVNFGLMLLLIWLIARRRIGWIRYVLAVLFVLGLYGALRTLPEELRSTPLDSGLNLVQLVLQGAALVLVFARNARPWFAKAKAAPAPPPA